MSEPTEVTLTQYKTTDDKGQSKVREFRLVLIAYLKKPIQEKIRDQVKFAWGLSFFLFF